MAETPVPPQEGEASAPEAPAPTTEEIQTLIATEAQKQVDARIPKFQSGYEKQIASLRKELAEVRNSTLSESELVDQNQSELEAELAKARREADALRAGRMYPETYPVFERMTAASTVEEQLEILQGFVKDASAPATPDASARSAADPAVEPTPPVDPNRPLAEPTPMTTGGVSMDANLAQRIIDSVGDAWPTR